MKSYTIKELSTFFESKYYITKERFDHYFSLKYGFSKDELKKAYEIYIKFPNVLQNVENEYQYEYIDKIISYAVELLEDIKNSYNFSTFSYDSKDVKKIFYREKEDGPICNVVIDMCNSIDIIAYAELLKRIHKIVAVRKMVDDISTKPEEGNNRMQIFDGDFFSTDDLYWGNKSNVYVVDEKGVYRRLLYIKGKGYLKNDGLNIDDEHEYNYHALTLCERFRKLGNITTDLHLLKDSE